MTGPKMKWYRVAVPTIPEEAHEEVLAHSPSRAAKQAREARSWGNLELEVAPLTAVTRWRPTRNRARGEVPA